MAKTILIVEDNELNLKVFNDSHRFYSLEKWNLNFVIAFKGYDKDKSKESIEKVLTYVNNEIDNDFKIKFFEPVNFSNEESIETITSKLNKILEEMIIKSPEQWIWTHNRWK